MLALLSCLTAGLAASLNFEYQENPSDVMFAAEERDENPTAHERYPRQLIRRPLVPFVAGIAVGRLTSPYRYNYYHPHYYHGHGYYGR